MTNSTLMLDTVGSNVPEILRVYGTHHPVQGYIWQPGVFSYIPWTAAQLAEFPAGHMLTATRPGRPEDARHAREIDVETSDATAEDVVPWLTHRHEYGHHDGQVYCDLSNVVGVLKAIWDGGIWDEPWWHLRIAWYWGRASAPTQGQVVAEVASFLTGSGLAMPPAWRVKMCQWQGSPGIDKNAVYGPLDFTRP